MRPSAPTPRPVRRRAVAAAAALSASALLATACSGGGGNGGGGDGAPSDTSTVSYALPPNATPNWILPVTLPGYSATHNSAIHDLLWTPLVAYNGATGDDITWDEQGSAAQDVTFSDDGLTATVTLKDMSWSDGTPVTSRDVEFWFNLVSANKDRWASYAEGRMPDDVTSLETPDEKTVVITFDQAYSQDWLLATQLSLIIPLPQHAWDKTSADGDVSDLDRTPEGATQVLDFLMSRAENINGYADDPLWDTINGPYAMERYTSRGEVTLQQNADYDGDDAASIPTVEFLPFTSQDAELNAVRSGEVDYGYIPASSMSQESQFTSLGYDVDPWEGWSVTYMPINFNNPQMGPVFAQQYARQAMQQAVDQQSISDVVWQGAALPDYGPVPQNPETQYLSDAQVDQPYPFDTDAANALLTDHGWTAGDDGVMVCTSPGSGDDQCGDGVQQGQRFAVTVLSQSGSDQTDNMMAAIQSSFAEAGMDFSIEPAPLNSVLSRTARCEPEQPECSWQLSFFGTAGSWYFPAYPSGERIFGTGATSNFGSYSNPQADDLMRESVLGDDGVAAMQEYSELLALDLPVLWMPNPVYQVSVIRSGLDAGGQDPLASFHPQRWSWSD